MLDDRKTAILRAVVEEYVRTAQPVGSALVAGRADLPVSAATVRNEMAVLERDGYLVQPHTSAGRIPTDQGYRCYVDSLTGRPGQLDPVMSLQVGEFFARAHGELERMLADTSRLLSTVTDYAAVVVGPPQDVAIVRSVQLVGLGGRVALAVIVLSNGSVEKCSVEIEPDTSDVVLAATGVHLSSTLVGRPWGSGVAVPPSGDAAVDALADRVLPAVTRAAGGLAGSVYVGGASRMAVAFDAVGTIREVLGILEQQVVVVGLISDILDRGLTVSIGAEHGVPSLADCSVIVAPYELGGDRVGTVGILGPTRMHYEQTLAAVAVVSKQLSRALSEGA